MAVRGGGRGCARADMVTQVELAALADAYLSCLTHALSTEREEVMGLLLGEVRKHLQLISNDNAFDQSHRAVYKMCENNYRNIIILKSFKKPSAQLQHTKANS